MRSNDNRSLEDAVLQPEAGSVINEALASYALPDVLLE